jgi:hypothetical protein
MDKVVVCMYDVGTKLLDTHTMLNGSFVRRESHHHLCIISHKIQATDDTHCVP